MVFDAVLCVARRHNRIAVKAIRSLRLFTQCRHILVFTSASNATMLQRLCQAGDTRVRILDEDTMISGTNLETVRAILDRRIGVATRAGWYFQQFLKMYACHLPGIADHYLIWDSDTILLRPLEFFDAHARVLVTPTNRHNKPYFESMRHLLGLDKQTDFSFVAEHLMVNTAYMQELLDNMTARAPAGTPLVEAVLDAVPRDHLGAAGFSEYETYGNFVAHRHPDSFIWRPLKATRRSAKLYGMRPNACILYRLMGAGYVYATFESWQRRSSPRIKLNRAMARLYCAFHRLTRHHRASFAAAEMLCRGAAPAE